MMSQINLLTDTITIFYTIMQILLGISVMNQVKKGFYKSGLAVLIILTIFNYLFLNMFYIRANKF